MIFIEVRCDKCGSVGLSRRCFYARQMREELKYRTTPQTPYQRLMRGEIDASAFVGTLPKRPRSGPPEANREDEAAGR